MGIKNDEARQDEEKIDANITMFEYGTKPLRWFLQKE